MKSSSIFRKCCKVIAWLVKHIIVIPCCILLYALLLPYYKIINRQIAKYPNLPAGMVVYNTEMVIFATIIGIALIVPLLIMTVASFYYYS